MSVLGNLIESAIKQLNANAKQRSVNSVERLISLRDLGSENVLFVEGVFIRRFCIPKGIHRCTVYLKLKLPRYHALGVDIVLGITYNKDAVVIVNAKSGNIDESEFITLNKEVAPFYIDSDSRFSLFIIHNDKRFISPPLLRVQIDKALSFDEGALPSVKTTSACIETRSLNSWGEF